ncbi:hypothetical protein [Bacillus toyonensis]|uniref:hypothetical protein n=1 Tax=Bacillus toyonensis TaxID=155322 RepID=UPI002E1C75F4|nr:hypothetical protein [Bacillus toyonensis]
MTIFTKDNNELKVMWTHLLKKFENVAIQSIVTYTENLSQLYFSFEMNITTKKGKFVDTTISLQKSLITGGIFAYFSSNIKTKELKLLVSEMLDEVIENIEHLHPSLIFTTMAKETKYPDSYYPIKERIKKVKHQ